MKKNPANECARRGAQLTDYLAGELPGREAEAVRRHLEHCAVCRASARNLAMTLDLARDALADPAAAGALPQRLSPERRARLERLAAQPRRTLTFDRWAILEAAAAVLVLGVFAGLLFPAIGSHRLGQSRTKTAANGRSIEHTIVPVETERLALFDGPTDKSSTMPARPAPAATPPAPSVSGEGNVLASARAPDSKLERFTDRPPTNGLDFGLESRSRSDDLYALDSDEPARGPGRSSGTESGAKPLAPAPRGRLADELSQPLPPPSGSASAPIVMRGLFAGRSQYGVATGGEKAGEPRAEPAPPLPSVPLPEPDASKLSRNTEASPGEMGKAIREERARSGSRTTRVTDRVNGEPQSAAETAYRKEEDESADEQERSLASRDDLEPSTVIEPAEFHPFISTADQPFSTFAMDVDTASYALARRYLADGRLPPPEMVRTEEFLNAFDYDYAPPAGPVFAIHAASAPSPFRGGFDLLCIGVKARRLGRDAGRGAVLTLVLDTSGSMHRPDRLERLRRALREMVERLAPDDELAIVTFSDRARLALDVTPAAQRERILATLDALAATGPTHLEAGLRLGYEIAARHFRSGASNRVMLMTDGVVNMGETEAEALLAAVEQFRRQGIYLSVFGVGAGVYDDDRLKTLAMKGDGVYAFLDSDAEARRWLVEELAATLHTVAADAKIQVEFNPLHVRQWRQLGYERRALTQEQFRDDTADAGEVGSGQSVTALYEIELAESPVAERRRAPIATVRIRYRDVESGAIEERERRITDADRFASFEAAPPRYQLAVIAAEFAEYLRRSPYAAGVDLNEVADAARRLAMALPLDARVAELARLIAQAARLLAP